jgi:hypothetical protein
MTITKISPREEENSPAPREEGWRFFIDTPKRRYELKADEEYKMWYWIEGLDLVNRSD